MSQYQVDDLKEKLAAQEVELKQKNEDADALIQRVGVEQEKVRMGIWDKRRSRVRNPVRMPPLTSCLSTPSHPIFFCIIILYAYSATISTYLPSQVFLLYHCSSVYP